MDLAERTLAEYLEAERRQYHERIQAERARTVEKALVGDAAPTLERQGWHVTRRGD